MWPLARRWKSLIRLDSHKETAHGTQGLWLRPRPAARLRLARRWKQIEPAKNQAQGLQAQCKGNYKCSANDAVPSAKRELQAQPGRKCKRPRRPGLSQHCSEGVCQVCGQCGQLLVPPRVGPARALRCCACPHQLQALPPEPHRLLSWLARPHHLLSWPWLPLAL